MARRLASAALARTLARTLAPALSLGLAAPALTAQEGLPSLPGLQDTLAEIAGREVIARGHIGSGLDFTDDEALSFALPDRTTFAVVFDAGREARRQLEGCEFEMFGGTPCPATVKAEIEMEGSRVRLIIFEVMEIGPPEAF